MGVAALVGCGDQGTLTRVSVSRGACFSSMWPSQQDGLGLFTWSVGFKK